MISPPEALKRAQIFAKENPTGVIALVGATASGKTVFSLDIAEKIGRAEILCVDSRQVYRGMDISSAKVQTADMRGIPHHGLNLINPDEKMDAYAFQQYGFGVMEATQKRGNIPILCGGTMLWVDALLRNYDFGEKGEKSARVGEPKWPVLWLGCHWEREKLYARIDARARAQFAAGLIEEAQDLFARYKNLSHNALTSFGYAEIAQYLQGEISIERALEVNQQRNRNYAKRQLTWWRGREEIIWVQPISYS